MANRGSYLDPVLFIFVSISWPSPFEEEVDNEQWKLGVESGKMPDSDHAAHRVSYQEALQVRVLRLAQRVL